MATEVIRLSSSALAALAMSALLALTPPVWAAADAAALFEDARTRLAAGDTAGAMIQLRNCVQAERRHIGAWLLLGQLQIDTGDPAAGMHSIEQAIDLGADADLTLPQLARSMLYLGRLDDLIALDPGPGLTREKRAEFLVIQGNALLEAQRARDALARYTAALEMQPGRADAERGRALARNRLGRTDEALEAADSAVELAPDDAESWYVRGEIRRARREFEQALADFGHALRLRQGHTPAQLGRAAVLSDQGRLEEALTLLLEIRESSPQELQGLYLLSQVQLALGDEQGAEETLAQARDIVKGLPTELIAFNLPALMISAIIDLRENEPARAREHLDYYLQHSPNHAGASRLLAIALLRLNDGVQAKRVLKPLVSAAPDDPQLQLLLGVAQALAGEVEAAQAAYEKVRAAGMSTGWFHKLLGIAQARDGELDDAQRSFARALDDTVTDTDANLLAAYIHIQRSEPRKALALAARLVESQPENPSYRNLLGALHLMLGERSAAAAEFERAVLLAPEFHAAHLNLAELARQEGRFDDASARYGELLKRDHRDIAALRGLVEVASSAGRLDESIRWLEDIRDLRPDLLDDRVVLLQAYLKADRMTDALTESDDLVKLGRDDARVVAAAAEVESRAGSRAGARSILMEFAARDDLAARELELLAATQNRLGFTKDARATRERLLATQPTNVAVRYALFLDLLREGDTEAAATHVEKLRADAPNAMETLLADGDLALMRGDARLAVERFEEAYARSGSATAADKLARALLADGRGEAAVELVRRHVLEGEGDSEREMLLATVLGRSGRHADAAGVYEAILARDPKYWRARNNLAWTYAELGDERAIEEARRALADNPGEPAALDTAGWILARAGQLDEALGLLREAYSRDSREPAIRLHLAETLLELGRRDEALDLLGPLAQEPVSQAQRRAQALWEEHAE